MGEKILKLTKFLLFSTALVCVVSGLIIFIGFPLGFDIPEVILETAEYGFYTIIASGIIYIVFKDFTHTRTHPKTQ